MDQERLAQLVQMRGQLVEADRQLTLLLRGLDAYAHQLRAATGQLQELALLSRYEREMSSPDDPDSARDCSRAVGQHAQQAAGLLRELDASARRLAGDQDH